MTIHVTLAGVLEWIGGGVVIVAVLYFLAFLAYLFNTRSK